MKEEPIGWKKLNMMFRWKNIPYQHVLVGIHSGILFHVDAVWPLSSVSLSHTVSSITLYMLTYTYVQTVCALACAPLLFLNCDTKCYGPNWGVRRMLSPILSLSVPSDALQAREDGLGDFAMCLASIIYDHSLSTSRLWYSVIVKIDQLNALRLC